MATVSNKKMVSSYARKQKSNSIMTNIIKDNKHREKRKIKRKGVKLRTN